MFYFADTKLSICCIAIISNMLDDYFLAGPHRRIANRGETKAEHFFSRYRLGKVQIVLARNIALEWLKLS